MSPYWAGFGLGLTLLLAYVFYGKGLGSTAAMMRTVVSIEKLFATAHVQQNSYLASYGAFESNPLNNWVIFQIIGLIFGSFLSGIWAGRAKKETNKGPRISNKQRFIYSVIGGVLFGFGARLARGCTSGVALSGGATLSLGSWVTMLCIFGGAYIIAPFIRKLWV
ncbi:MAG: hypothetical protein A2504_00725 [Bdellovibrionales bacterium RIFOXYD12_FULL_39_22]|nr:MAG: hypothetical protein A2385_03345 [Bdellovibrionales bacterium RIFOXYB1_FULL_39_21]OFZ42666.1 MAG: hypothetical protein A2485_09960 [Bdellovibrionales bacterium RIFOXYC12_FULL_39_17]OFZ47156.1 MAG: hypothetical protein A2404_15335 [Bdellovibrionales bacterium RIFOXYC1_FULL_39_130]OFZ72383.1 MAG: hypothetical protein A2451_12320 [Bdellovibrionales bacterium RIFOXYC2_FULL_39_8]OFZ75404.1 MAG: hypothetical protein A2560_14110 [Bdellovibrionales bacterium RIFOXYD1_FULL_39_84]OFZ93355.1 MAG: